MDKTNYIILPGYGNSGSTHWQTYFEKILPNAERVQHNSWDFPIAKVWIEAVDKTMEKYDPSTVVFITHSLGGITLLLWLQQTGKTIKGAFIVAPPDVENLDNKLPIPGFYPLPLEKLSFPSILVASTNDTWCKVERARFFAEKWGSEYYELESAGHINQDSGFGMWGDGLQMIKGLC